MRRDVLVRALRRGHEQIVVPRSIFLESKLKANFDKRKQTSDKGYYWPLSDATLYGEDLAGTRDPSEGVAGVIAKTLSGSGAYNVLNRLLRDPTNVVVYSYVDITSYAVLANLPADVVRILPWAGVVNGATGAPPEGFSDWFLNSLIEVGQLLYKGLVALGTFLADLAEAIADWGMRALGAVSEAVAGAVEVVADALDTFVAWIVDFFMSLVRLAIDGLISGLRSLGGETKDSITLHASAIANNPTDQAAQENRIGLIADTLFTSVLFALVFSAIGAITIAFAMTTPITGLVSQVTTLLAMTVLTTLTVGLAVTLLGDIVDPSRAVWDLLPAETKILTDVGFAVADLVLIAGFALRQATSPFKVMASFVPVSTMFFLFSLALLAISAWISSGPVTKVNLLAAVIADAFAVVMTVAALVDKDLKMHEFVRRAYGIFAVMDTFMGIASLATGLAYVGFDTIELVNNWHTVG